MKEALRTLRQSLVSLAILFTLVFVVIRTIPGDPARLMAGVAATDAHVGQIRAQLGLDQPVPVQFYNFLQRLARGDLGRSTLTNRAVYDDIRSRLPNTALLVLVGMGLAVAFAVPAGFAAGARRNSTFDLVVTSIAVAATSIPAFGLALVLIDLFAVRWGLLPSSGIGEWRHLVLPAIVLASTQVGMILRLTRGSVIEVLRADYIRTARAKGVPPLEIMTHHVMRNAAVPTITVIGLQTGLLLGGAVVTETVFSWPGVGALLIQAVQYRDYPMIQGLVLLFGIAFVLINLSVDLVNRAVDPRLRHEH